MRQCSKMQTGEPAGIVWRIQDDPWLARVSCVLCGQVEVPVGQVEVSLAKGGRSSYGFSCPRCGESSLFEVDSAVARWLVAHGALEVTLAPAGVGSPAQRLASKQSVWLAKAARAGKCHRAPGVA